jgi:hypothetical protein
MLPEWKRQGMHKEFWWGSLLDNGHLREREEDKIYILEKYN